MNFGGLRHTDAAYLAEPPMATMLIAREVPRSSRSTLGMRSRNWRPSEAADGSQDSLSGLYGWFVFAPMTALIILSTELCKSSKRLRVMTADSR